MCEAVTAAVVKQLSGIQRQLKNVSYVGSFKQLCESYVKITKTIYNQTQIYCAVKLFNAHWYICADKFFLDVEKSLPQVANAGLAIQRISPKSRKGGESM